MITQLRLKNFKSWVDTGELRLAPLTGFFGTNSSGKSSLLQPLLLLKQTTEYSDRTIVFRTGGKGAIDYGTIPELVHEGADSLELSVSWQLPELLEIPIPQSNQSIQIKELDFTTQVHALPNNIYVERLSYEGKDFEAALTRQSNNSYTIDVSVAGKPPLRPQSRPRVHMTPVKAYGFSPEALRAYQDTDYLNDLVFEFEQLFRRIYYLGPLREYPQRFYSWAGEPPTDVGLKGEQAVAALLARGNDPLFRRPGRPPKNNTLEARVAEWLKEMGLVDSFRTVPLRSGGTEYELRVRRSPQSKEVLLTDIGFGVSQVLPVLVLCYYVPEGSTIILEQPEIHLHPSAQSWLADVLIDVILYRNIQMIVESHSEHFLGRLQRRIAEDLITVEKTALYFCEMENGASVVKSLDIDPFGNIRNWPKDFFGDLTGDLLQMAEKGLERQLSQQ